MEWDFTPDDVLKGKAEYSLGRFRDDLRNEVRAQLGAAGEEHVTALFHLIYDTCYWLATEGSLDDLPGFYGGTSTDLTLLRVIERQNQDNIEMLKAIIKRRYVGAVDAGLTQAEALSLLMEE